MSYRSNKRGHHYRRSPYVVDTYLFRQSYRHVKQLRKANLWLAILGMNSSLGVYIDAAKIYSRYMSSYTANVE